MEDISPYDIVEMRKESNLENFIKRKTAEKIFSDFDPSKCSIIHFSKSVKKEIEKSKKKSN